MFDFVQDEERNMALRNEGKALLQQGLETYYRAVYDKEHAEDSQDPPARVSPPVTIDGPTKNKLLTFLEMSPVKASTHQSPLDRTVYVKKKVDEEMEALKHLRKALYTDASWYASYEKNELGLIDIVGAYQKHVPDAKALFAIFCSNNVIASTSANPERMFSVCGNIENKRNKGTSSGLVNNSRAFCKTNQQHFPETKRISLYLKYLDNRGTGKTRRGKNFDSVRGIEMKQAWKNRLFNK